MAEKETQPPSPKEERCMKRTVLYLVIGILLVFVVTLLGYVIYEKFFNGADEESCTYNGMEYAHGESFPATDGCNSCSCQGGEVICTLMECLGEEPEVEEGQCKYDGMVYEAGDTFMAADGCNSCTCGENGMISCTQMYCGE